MSLPLSHLRDSTSTKFAVGRAQRMNSSVKSSHVGWNACELVAWEQQRYWKECGHETCIEWCWKNRKRSKTMQTDLYTILCDNTVRHTVWELESEILTHKPTPHACALKSYSALWENLSQRMIDRAFTWDQQIKHKISKFHSLSLSVSCNRDMGISLTRQ